MTLPNRLAALRKRAGISAAALSDLAGLSPAHVAMIEQGARPNLAASTALALARTLGTTIEHLVLGEGVEPTDAAVKAAIERARAARGESAAEVQVDRAPEFDQRPPVAEAG